MIEKFYRRPLVKILVGIETPQFVLQYKYVLLHICSTLSSELIQTARKHHATRVQAMRPLRLPPPHSPGRVRQVWHGCAPARDAEREDVARLCGRERDQASPHARKEEGA